MSEILNYINKLSNNNSLSKDEVSRILQIISHGGATPAQISAILMGLKVKKETTDELIGTVEYFRIKSQSSLNHATNIIPISVLFENKTDFYIRFTTVLIIASCGFKVCAYFPYQAIPFLKELAVISNIPKEDILGILNDIGICIITYPAKDRLRVEIEQVKRDLDLTTIIDIGDPLLNPILSNGMIINSISAKYGILIAECLKKLGLDKAFIITEQTSNNDIVNEQNLIPLVILKDNEVKSINLPCEPIEIEEIYIDYDRFFLLLNNSDIHNFISAYLNAAISLALLGKVRTISEGIILAKDTLASGKVKQLFKSLIERTSIYSDLK